MSHSPTDCERAWDFGMVDSDVIAFPVSTAGEEKQWTLGRLSEPVSYWHERNWVQWQPVGKVNYVRVARFRAAPPFSTKTKGVTGVKPENEHDLRCPGVPPEGRHLPQLVASCERTQRFTGVKLARLRRDASLRTLIANLESDPDEDVYIRLEAVAYLVAVHSVEAAGLFGPYLWSPDPQIQLEAVISLAEAGTDECVRMLGEMLDDDQQPYFARSAAAWCLSQIGGTEACQRLVQAFGDTDPNLREEALEGIVTINSDAVPILLSGLREVDPAIAAGCAEALRQQGRLSDDTLREIAEQLAGADPSVWAVWLAGHLPRQRLASVISRLQATAPEVHYAITLLWSFVESWVARRWELQPRASLPVGDDQQ